MAFVSAAVVSVWLLTDYAQTRGSPLPAGISPDRQIIAAFLLAQVPWLRQIAFNIASWSVSAECGAYLLFPVLATLLLSGGRWRCNALMIVAFCGAVFLHTTGRVEIYGWFALARALFEFAIGMLTYRRFNLYHEITWRKRDAGLAIIFLALVGAANIPVPALSDVAAILIFPALLMAAVSNAGRLGWLLNSRPFVWLGEISYSLYIIQFIPLEMIALFHHYEKPVLAFTFSIIFSVAFAALTYRTIEVPARRLLRELPGRLVSQQSSVSQ